MSTRIFLSDASLPRVTQLSNSRSANLERGSCTSNICVDMTVQSIFSASQLVIWALNSVPSIRPFYKAKYKFHLQWIRLHRTRKIIEDAFLQRFVEFLLLAKFHAESYYILPISSSKLWIRVKITRLLNLSLYCISKLKNQEIGNSSYGNTYSVVLPWDAVRWELLFPGWSTSISCICVLFFSITGFEVDSVAVP